jgi:hypothetical protein
MTITPKALASRRNAVDFAFAGEPVHLEYYPTVLSQMKAGELNDLAARANHANTEEEAQAVTLEMCQKLAPGLAAWDYVEFVNPDGTPGPMVPLTPERLAQEMEQYPDFIIACLQACFAHMQQGNATGTTASAPSAATSSPMVDSTISPVESSQNPSA